MLVVAASGNEGVGQLSYPAKAKWVVAVGATTEDGCLGYYSNYGTGLDARRPRRRRRLGPPRRSATATPTPATDGDIYQETFADVESPNVRVLRPPDGLLRHLDGRAARQRDRRADHRERRARASPDGRRDHRPAEATATPLGANGNDPRHYGAGLVNAAAATAPIGSTGPTGPTRADRLDRATGRPSRRAQRRLAAPGRYAVRMISTAHGAWCEIRFGTEPSRNRFAPGAAAVADDDQVGAALLGDIEDRVRRIAALGVEIDLDAGGREHRRRARERRVDGLAGRGPSRTRSASSLLVVLAARTGS